ncbi:hypothetical protein [Flavobacterium suncheonense]|uniref:DUF4259 domain-containing protein n=1 Tax=Flavobacterium suncheonense GH29-5 = DSM 17707 TaxID=1121899 RepID=A0A0A2M1D8_9FLAO|nr:hypothetical protein [Flavobacterium suncheonense]KGO86079.1 hypothetical protein Q764_13825 [Flavobacterium suncheonense GH29-5 = DSM 17707]
MGAWGTAISSNDTYSDIYEAFFTLYNDGFNVIDISKKLIADNQEIINDSDDSNNFWFALAKAQWECKELDSKLLERIKQIIETGSDLEVWKNLGAIEKDIKKRKIVLEKFYNTLQSEKTKAKTRKKKILVQPIFEKGDCLTFQLENENYGGAIVLESIKDSELGINLIAITRINQKSKPTLPDFKIAEVLVLNFALWKNKQEIGWFYPISIKRDKTKFEVVDNMKIQMKFDPNDYSKGYYFGGSLDSVKEKIELQFEFEKDNPKPELKIEIEELIK